MEFGISTQYYGKQKLSTDLLEELRSAGYQHIELFCNRPHLDFHDRTVQRDIARWFQDNDMPPPSLHLPFLERTETGEKIWISAIDRDRNNRDKALDEMKRALELADRMPLAHAVLHLGVPGEEFALAHFDYAFVAVDRIRSFAGVPILIENIPNEISTIGRIHEFLATARLSDIGICYDSGHAHLQGAVTSLDRVAATHLHDNGGELDQHLWPFEGTMNWPELIARLVSADYKGRLVFEARGSDLSKGNNARRRLEDLWAEARESLDAFMEKHNLTSEEG